MKSLAMLGLVTLTFVGALAWAAVAAGAESRTQEQCAAIFHHLNTSGTGKLTLNEAARDSTIAKELDDPALWMNGYVTEGEFTPLCMRGGAKAEPTTESK